MRKGCRRSTGSPKSPDLTGAKTKTSCQPLPWISMPKIDGAPKRVAKNNDFLLEPTKKDQVLCHRVPKTTRINEDPWPRVGPAQRGQSLQSAPAASRRSPCLLRGWEARSSATPRHLPKAAPAAVAGHNALPPGRPQLDPMKANAQPKQTRRNSQAPKKRKSGQKRRKSGEKKEKEQKRPSGTSLKPSRPLARYSAQAKARRLPSSGAPVSATRPRARRPEAARSRARRSSSLAGG